ncbi:MAG: hypothetical protein GY832_21980 [Chloroflexi bacterium]|nr:hypothetical protein [Chloroflexota bacterium]
MANRELQKVRFIVAWQNYRVGDIIQPNGVLRDWLMCNGYIELVEDAPEERSVEPECAVLPGTETAMKPKPKRKRKPRARKAAF